MMQRMRGNEENQARDAARVIVDAIEVQFEDLHVL